VYNFYYGQKPPILEIVTIENVATNLFGGEQETTVSKAEGEEGFDEAMAAMYKDLETRETGKVKKYIAWRDMLQIVFRQAIEDGGSGNEGSGE
jgi:hypothetical protein